MQHDIRLDISLTDIPPLIEALERLEDVPPEKADSELVVLSGGERLRISVETWRRLIRHLRALHPLRNNRLVVKRARLWDYCGLTYPPTPGGTITIRVSGHQTMREQIDTLLHEWAHAVSFDRGRDETHSDAWGKELAAIYRTWEEWNG